MSDPRSSPLTAIAVGGLVAGVLDITDAVVLTWMLGGSPARMLRYIASALVGPPAIQGGLGMTAVGLACHFAIALGVATVYVLASRKWPVLVRRPVVCGLVFGIAVFFFMQHVVLPLSALRLDPFALRVSMNGLLIHAFGVGLPIALAARYFAPPPVPAPVTR